MKKDKLIDYKLSLFASSMRADMSLLDGALEEIGEIEPKKKRAFGKVFASLAAIAAVIVTAFVVVNYAFPRKNAPSKSSPVNEDNNQSEAPAETYALASLKLTKTSVPQAGAATLQNTENAEAAYGEYKRAA